MLSHPCLGKTGHHRRTAVRAEGLESDLSVTPTAPIMWQVSCRALGPLYRIESSPQSPHHPSFRGEKNRGLKKWSDLPKITKLVTDGVELEPRPDKSEAWAPSPATPSWLPQGLSPSGCREDATPLGARVPEPLQERQDLSRRSPQAHGDAPGWQRRTSRPDRPGWHRARA